MSADTQCSGCHNEARVCSQCVEDETGMLLARIVAYLSAPNEDGTPCSVERQMWASRIQKEFGR